MRKLVILLIISGLYFSAQGQTFSIRVNSGIDFFNMTQMKKLQKEIGTHMPGAKNVTEFPPYYNFQLQAAYIITPIYTAGVYADYVSTGGRIDYEDYSGIFRSDQIISRISAGFLFESSAFTYSGFSLDLSLKTSYQISKLKLKNIFRVFDYTQGNSSEYNSSGFGIEPGFDIGYSFLYFFIRLEASYQFSSSGTFTSKNGAKLTTGSYESDEIKPQWIGFKSAVTFGVNI